MDYESIWNGERGNCLCSEGPSLSCAARMVMEADVEDAPRTGRGYRPIGGRYRDTVYAVIDDRLSVAQICAKMESTGPVDMILISRALRILVNEGMLARELVKIGRGRPRWVYWRP